MGLNRQYTQESLLRMMDKLRQSQGEAFLDSVAPAIPGLKDYDFVVAFLIKLLTIVLGKTVCSDERKITERIAALFHPVFINIITDADRAKHFLSKLDNGKTGSDNTLKEVRNIFAAKLHHAIHHSADLESILSMLKDDDQIQFICEQNKYWFVHLKNCRLAFLSGRHPKSTETFKLFGALDRHVVVKILHEADLLPRPQKNPK